MHHREEQDTLLKLSQALLSETDAQVILDQVARVAAESLKVEFAAIALVDADGQHFSGRAAVGWVPEIFQRAQRIPLADSTGLAYAIRTQTPVVIFDGKDGSFHGAIYVGGATHIKIDGDRSVGYDVFSDRSHELYPPKHMDTLEAALDYIAALDVPSPAERDGNLMNLRATFRRNKVDLSKRG